MSRKRYTQKGLDTTIREAQERHRRLEMERLGCDPLEAAAALTRRTHELEEAETSQTRSELHLVGEAEMLDVLYVEAGLEEFEVLLEREAGR